MKRIYKIGIISSPLMALYAVTPIYVFRLVSSSEIIPMFLVITTYTFIYWLINIFVLSFTRQKKIVIRYLYSYFFTFLFQFSFVQIVKSFDLMSPKLSSHGTYAFVYPLISYIVFNSVILIIVELLRTQEKNLNAEIKIEKLTVSNLEAEKKILQQQLQPHFLFNSLSTLKSLIKESPDDAENYTIKLSEFLRYSIDSHKNELVSLEDELHFTQGYIELQKARFPNSFFCEIVIDSNILDRRIPVFGLQTLVENAIKHNQFTSKRPLTIEISSKGNSISVTNNRLQKNPSSSGTGTGLNNLNKRYLLIADENIDITETPATFTVTLKLL